MSDFARINPAHLVNYVEADGTEDLPSSHYRLIRQKYVTLIETMDPDSGLLAFLFQKEVLSDREIQRVRSYNDRFMKNETLLSLISWKSSHDFTMFIDALKESNQESVSAMLSDVSYEIDVNNLTYATSSQVNKVEDSKEETTNQNSAATSQGETAQLLRTENGPITKVNELEKMIEDKNKRIIDLEHELESKIKRAATAAETIQIQSDEIEILQETNRTSQSIISQVKVTVRDLEQHLYPAGEPNNVLKSQIKQLENEVDTLQQRIVQQGQTIQKYQQNEESYKRTVLSLQYDKEQVQLENKQLKVKVKDLEQHLYAKENIDYADKPDLANALSLSEMNKGKPINGLAILKNKLFVVTESSQEIEVYDSKTFHLDANRKVDGLTDPMDITSSKTDNCLYIIDRVRTETNSRIMKITPKGSLLRHWLTGGENGRLSTYESNVIVCLSDELLIKEYSPKGELIVKVRLSPAAKLNHPWLAIKVTSADFVVSHGDGDDDLHRVCVVDLDGNIKRECTKGEISNMMIYPEMKVPICLLEDNERSIIVADRDNNRLLMLSSQLNYQRKLIEKDHGLKGFPVRLCFDDTQSKLFVAVNKLNFSKKEWEDGSILIFNMECFT